MDKDIKYLSQSTFAYAAIRNRDSETTYFSSNIKEGFLCVQPSGTQ